jgi:hypothetical protein
MVASRSATAFSNADGVVEPPSMAENEVLELAAFLLQLASQLAGAFTGRCQRLLNLLLDSLGDVGEAVGRQQLRLQLPEDLRLRDLDPNRQPIRTCISAFLPRPSAPEPRTATPARNAGHRATTDMALGEPGQQLEHGGHSGDGRQALDQDSRRADVQERALPWETDLGSAVRRARARHRSAHHARQPSRRVESRRPLANRCPIRRIIVEAPACRPAATSCRSDSAHSFLRPSYRCESGDRASPPPASRHRRRADEDR